MGIDTEELIEKALSRYSEIWRMTRGEDHPDDDPTPAEACIWGLEKWWEKNDFDYSYKHYQYKIALASFAKSIDKSFVPTFEQEREFVLRLRNVLRIDLGLPELTSEQIDRWNYREVDYSIPLIPKTGQPLEIDSPSKEVVHEFYEYVRKHAPTRFHIIEKLKVDYFSNDDESQIFIGGSHMSYLNFFGDILLKFVPNKSTGFYERLVDRFKAVNVDNFWANLQNLY